MWFARKYNPIEAGSIDGTDIVPHDRALLRAADSRYITKNPLNTLFVNTFASYGEIIKTTIVSDFVTGDPRGYGFVEFVSEKDCQEAYRNSRRLIIDQRQVIVDYERGRIMKGWRPRRVGGGFGGRKDSGQLRFGARDRPFQQPIVDIGKDQIAQDRATEIARIARYQRSEDCWRAAYMEEQYESTRRERQKHRYSPRQASSQHYDKVHRQDTTRHNNYNDTHHIHDRDHEYRSSKFHANSNYSERRHRSRSSSRTRGRHHYEHRHQYENSDEYRHRSSHKEHSSHRRATYSRERPSTRPHHNEHRVPERSSRHDDRHQRRRSRSPPSMHHQYNEQYEHRHHRRR
ncbi:hypothetical protein BDF19DRAFT_446382 [Syncephalis fuscata]|nr:hypothetical protein BDF19DRAFT_446382 [Syncephalis fuscata]